MTRMVLGLVACLAASSVAVAAGRPSGGGGNGSRPTIASLCSAFDVNRDGVMACWRRLKSLPMFGIG